LLARGSRRQIKAGSDAASGFGCGVIALRGVRSVSVLPADSMQAAMFASMSGEPASLPIAFAARKRTDRSGHVRRTHFADRDEGLRSPEKFAQFCANRLVRRPIGLPIVGRLMGREEVVIGLA